jgi:hypothetical protein
VTVLGLDATTTDSLETTISVPRPRTRPGVNQKNAGRSGLHRTETEGATWRFTNRQTGRNWLVDEAGGRVATPV